MKRVETNLEHFINNEDIKVTVNEKTDLWELLSINYGININQATNKEWLIKWLLSAYQPKYKLKQFEIDFIKAFQESYGDNSFLESEWAVVRAWKKKGYLKGVPLQLEVKTILDNAEVINDD